MPGFSFLIVFSVAGRGCLSFIPFVAYAQSAASDRTFGKNSPIARSTIRCVVPYLTMSLRMTDSRRRAGLLAPALRIRAKSVAICTLSVILSLHFRPAPKRLPPHKPDFGLIRPSPPGCFVDVRTIARLTGAHLYRNQVQTDFCLDTFIREPRLSLAAPVAREFQVQLAACTL